MKTTLLAGAAGLVMLAGCRVLQIVLRVADARDELEPDLRMLLLIIRRLREDAGDLLEAVLLRLRRVIGILVPCLRLASESRPQIFLRLRSLEFHENLSS